MALFSRANLPPSRTLSEVLPAPGYVVGEAVRDPKWKSVGGALPHQIMRSGRSLGDLTTEAPDLVKSRFRVRLWRRRR
jgi:hypothetical protein